MIETQVTRMHSSRMLDVSVGGVPLKGGTGRVYQRYPIYPLDTLPSWIPYHPPGKDMGPEIPYPYPSWKDERIRLNS